MELLWQHRVGVLEASTYYNSEGREYIVEVCHIKSKRSLSETFPALWAPLFGMDLEDSNTSRSIAEELAIKLEKES